MTYDEVDIPKHRAELIAFDSEFPYIVRISPEGPADWEVIGRYRSRARAHLMAATTHRSAQSGRIQALGADGIPDVEYEHTADGWRTIRPRFAQTP